MPEVLKEVLNALFYPFIALILVVAYFVYMKRKYPKGLPTDKWDMNSVESRPMAEKMFHLMPGETVLHQSIGHVDPNSHVKESAARNFGLAMMGQKLKDPVVMHLILTDKERLILAPFNQNIERLIFDKNHIPKIRDTGRVGRFPKITWINTQEGRIFEFESELIPDFDYRHANAENMELTIPNDFIPILMNWAKNSQGKDEF